MAGSTTNYTSFATLRAVGIAMIVVSTIIFAARTAARFSQRGWRLQVEDLLVSLAYVFFLAMSIAYMIVIDPIYRLSALENGELAPSVALLEDADLVTKVFFCTTILLWLCLWSVKLAFLALYRRLMKGLPTYLRWWWGILGFTILTFIGALVSNFLSCASFKEWFTVGACSSRRDAIAQISSLYYAFAVDVLTDLMIMILPIRLVWNLRVSIQEKIGIVATLGMASLCILVAMVRVISVGSRSGVSTPSSSWLALWGMVEGAMAVVVACLPSFAIAIRRSYSSRKGYSYTSDNSKGKRPQDVPLRTIGSGPALTPHRSMWMTNAGAASQEDILRKSGEIAVVRTLHVDASDAADAESTSDYHRRRENLAV